MSEDINNKTYNSPAAAEPFLPSAPAGGNGFGEGGEIQGRGFLTVQVSLASRALPISGAVVTISDYTGAVIETQTTDMSGKTTPIELYAPSVEYSQSPGNVRPYSVYNARIEKDGFYTQQISNIAVFDGIHSIQPISMEPLDEDATENDRLNG